MELAVFPEVPGTVCYLRGDNLFRTCHYDTVSVDDLVSFVDGLLLNPQECRRVVWIEARGQIKAFHPLTCITTIRAATREITLAEYGGFSRERCYQLFRQGVIGI